MLKEFIAYLHDQLGEPYLWGGQHTRLTPENYVRVIEKKEAGRGKYPVLRSIGMCFVTAISLWGQPL